MRGCGFAHQRMQHTYLMPVMLPRGIVYLDISAPNAGREGLLAANSPDASLLLAVYSRPSQSDLNSQLCAVNETKVNSLGKHHSRAM